MGKYLLCNPSVINVHEDCRRQYLYVGVEEFKRPIDELDIQTSKNKFLRTTGSSDLRNQCFLCGKFAAIDLKHPNRTDVHAAKSDNA